MDEWNSFEILDPREAILLASLVPDSFFLKRSDDQTTDAYNIKLPLDFGDVWAADHLTVYPEVFEGDKKMVTFVKYWVPMWECDPGNVVRKKKERLRELDLFVRESGLEPADCLFVPYKEYRSGMQLGELLYHYVFGTIFKEMGYLVCNEFALAQYSGEKPDFCAFKTERIANALSQLRGEGVIWAGAFLEELQLFGVFGKQPYKARRLDSFEPITDADAVAVEVERTRGQRAGKSQLRGYLLGTQGLFSEGYVAGPSLGLKEGTLVLSREGELMHTKSEPAYQPRPLPLNLAEKRQRQLDDVYACLIVQLFKNLVPRKIVAACEHNGEVLSYSALMDSMFGIDVDGILDALGR